MNNEHEEKENPAVCKLSKADLEELEKAKNQDKVIVTQVQKLIAFKTDSGFWFTLGIWGDNSSSFRLYGKNKELRINFDSSGYCSIICDGKELLHIMLPETFDFSQYYTTSRYVENEKVSDFGVDFIYIIIDGEYMYIKEDSRVSEEATVFCIEWD